MAIPFPPSSRWSFFTPALRTMASPTSVLPVKETAPTFGLPARVSPTVRPPPVMTLKPPAGTPAFSRTRAKRIMLRGVSLAGFSTTELPARRAGMALAAAMKRG